MRRPLTLLLATSLLLGLLGGLWGCRRDPDVDFWTGVAWSPTEVRVLLARERERLLVSFPDGGYIDDPLGGRLFRVPAGWEVVFSRQGSALAVNGKPVGPASLVLRPTEGLAVSTSLHFDHADYGGEMVVGLEGSTGLRLVNRLEVEEYLRGVVPAETYASWPTAALESQALISRSYALAKIWAAPEAAWHLRADTGDQVYRGRGVEDPRTDAAIRATTGRVVVYEDRLITTFFSSCCGGHTTPVEEAWPGSRPEPYLAGVPCPWCVESHHYSWELRLGFEQLSDALRRAGYTTSPLSGLRPRTAPRSGRVLEVEFTSSTGETFTVGGNELRRVLGYGTLKSTRFRIASTDAQGLTLSGHGYGHGVGLCQWGSRGMAVAGHDAEEIISFYYPGAVVRDFRSLRPPS